MPQIHAGADLIWDRQTALDRLGGWQPSGVAVLAVLAGSLACVLLACCWCSRRQRRTGRRYKHKHKRLARTDDAPDDSIGDLTFVIEEEEEGEEQDEEQAPGRCSRESAGRAPGGRQQAVKAPPRPWAALPGRSLLSAPPAPEIDPRFEELPGEPAPQAVDEVHLAMDEAAAAVHPPPPLGEPAAPAGPHASPSAPPPPMPVQGFRPAAPEVLQDGWHAPVTIGGAMD